MQKWGLEGEKGKAREEWNWAEGKGSIGPLKNAGLDPSMAAAAADVAVAAEADPVPSASCDVIGHS